ncbi:MAG: chemotaxis protein CheW [Pseudomonadota bacterium]
MTFDYTKIGSAGDIVVIEMLGEELGIAVKHVREVLMPQQIHTLPGAPDFIEGVINLRGKSIIIMDMRKRFKVAANKSFHNRILICQIKHYIIGLIVDAVKDVVDLANKSVDPKPDLLNNFSESDCIDGVVRIGKRVIILLNLDTVLNKDEANLLSGMVK